MKKLADFQKEKIDVRSVFGGLLDAGTRDVEKCQCSEGHWHVDHVYPDA